uniref:Calmodulin-2/3/5 n=1 Tax=Ascaris suum TaxID=6253 RepID=F1LFW9_ASCSU
MEHGKRSATFEQIESDRLTEIREAFSVFDRDGDGRITVDELGAVMDSLGEHPSESELRRMISEFDEDGNGTIEMDEFLRLMARKARKTEAEEYELRRVFREFDKDSDGFISVEDLRSIMSHHGKSILHWRMRSRC